MQDTENRSVPKILLYFFLCSVFLFCYVSLFYWENQKPDVFPAHRLKMANVGKYGTEKEIQQFGLRFWQYSREVDEGFQVAADLLVKRAEVKIVRCRCAKKQSLMPDFFWRRNVVVDKS